MGLLDEAIREHLELKRMGGTDPGDLARKEQEALGPIGQAEDASEGYTTVLDASPDRASNADVSSIDVAPEEDLSVEVPATHDADSSSVGQETAELDMRTVLEEHAYASPTPAGDSPPQRGLDFDG
jgi:hypothetical protein